MKRKINLKALIYPRTRILFLPIMAPILIIQIYADLIDKYCPQWFSLFCVDMLDDFFSVNKTL